MTFPPTADPNSTAAVQLLLDRIREGDQPSDTGAESPIDFLGDETSEPQKLGQWTEFHEYVERLEVLREQGHDLTPEELCSDHPDLLEEIRWQIRALHAIEWQSSSLNTKE